MTVPKEQVEAWIATNPSKDNMLMAAGALGQIVHGTKDQVKAALSAHLAGLAAGTQVEFPFAGMPVPPAPVPVPAPAPAPAPRPRQPSIVDKAIKDMSNEAKEGARIAWNAIWHGKFW